MRTIILLSALSLCLLSAGAQPLVATPDHAHAKVFVTDGHGEVVADTLICPANSYQVFTVDVRTYTGTDNGKGKETIHVKNTNGVYSIPFRNGYDQVGPGLWLVSMVNGLPVLRLIGETGLKINWVIHLKRQSI